MLTCGIFDYRIIDVPARVKKPINLIFTGDTHWNSHNFARNQWERDNEDHKELIKREETYFVITGDTFEALSTSERKYLAGGNFHKSTTVRLEKEYSNEVKKYVKEASFLKGRTLAVFGGNHYFSFFDGTTSDMALASELKAPFIGYSGYLIINLVFDKHHTQTVRIFCHHGKGSGKRASSGFTAPEDALSYFRDADIIVMGHDHKAGAMLVPALECSRGSGYKWKIREVKRIIGRSGSYLRSYVPQVPSYAVDALMRPSTLGYLRVVITPMRLSYSEKGIDERWIDLKAVI